MWCKIGTYPSETIRIAKHNLEKVGKYCIFTRALLGFFIVGLTKAPVLLKLHIVSLSTIELAKAKQKILIIPSLSVQYNLVCALLDVNLIYINSEQIKYVKKRS